MMKWRKDRLIVSSFSKCFYFLIRNSFNFSFCRQINDQMLEDRKQIRKRISFLIRTILKVVHGYFYFISSMQSELQLSNVVTFFFFFQISSCIKFQRKLSLFLFYIYIFSMIHNFPTCGFPLKASFCL